MKYWISLLLLLLFAFANGQQIVDDYALIIPQNHILELKVTDEKLYKVTAAPCIIGQYPESNYQYKAYLEYLKKAGKIKLYEEALPQEEYLRSLRLGEEEISFFQEVYPLEENYSHYPIMGLTYDQVSKYFDWKTSELGFAYLEYNGGYTRANGAEMTIYQYKDSFKVKNLPIMPYTLPHQSMILSGVKSGYRKNTRANKNASADFQKWLAKNNNYNHLMVRKQRRKDVDHPILKKYAIKPSTYYDLKTIRKRLKNGERLLLPFLLLDKSKEQADSGRTFLEPVGIGGLQVFNDGTLTIAEKNQLLFPIRYSQFIRDQKGINKKAKKPDFSTF